jgi:hypothetical protein
MVIGNPLAVIFLPATLEILARGQVIKVSANIPTQLKDASQGK